MTTLGFAILGLLARESLSGYDLTQRMKGRVGFFWGAGHSQIYPELARLEEGGFVTHSVVEQRERPDKKVFEITERGLEALKGWAAEPPPRKPPKDELTLKAYSVWLADGAEAARLFSDEGRRHEEQLARYEEIRDWMEREWADDVRRPDSPRFASYAALRRGILYERGNAEWCRWLAGAVEEKPEGAGKPEKPGEESKRAKEGA
jgi:DNA-binding PadR family transcriptional regulator